MRLRGGKKAPDRRDLGRQRRHSDWQAPATYSYRAQRAERVETPGRKPSSLAQQRSRLLSVRFWLRRSGLLVAVIVGVVCAISIISLSNQPRIVLLDADKNQYAFHPAEQYQAAANKYLAGSIWNKNKITVNTGAASADLQRQFPELASVSVTLPLVGHRPIYHLEANPPAFIMQAVNGTYVLDSSGKALIARAMASGSAIDELPVIADQSGLHVQLNKQVISSQQAAFITAVITLLAAKQTTVSTMTLPANAAQELDVQVAGQAYVVKFNMHDPSTVRQQVGTYLATVHNLAGQHVTPAQYIDVRVVGRAYYQ